MNTKICAKYKEWHGREDICIYALGCHWLFALLCTSIRLPDKANVASNCYNYVPGKRCSWLNFGQYRVGIPIILCNDTLPEHQQT